MLTPQIKIEPGIPGSANLMNLEQVISNISASFEFLEKLEYSLETKQLVLWGMGTVGQIYDEQSNVIGETKVILEDFLDYINTRFSKEVKFGIQRFFKV